MTLENTLKRILVGGAIIGSSLSLTGCGVVTENKSITLDNARVDHSRLDLKQIYNKGPVLTGKYKVKGSPDGSWEAEGEGGLGSSSGGSGIATIEDCTDTKKISDEYTQEVDFVVEKDAKEAFYKVLNLFKIAKYGAGSVPNDDTIVRSDIAGKLLPYLEESESDPFYNRSGKPVRKCGSHVVLSREVLERVAARYQANTKPAPTSAEPNEEPAPEAPPVQNSMQAGYGNRGSHGRTHPRQQRRDLPAPVQRVYGDWLGRGGYTQGGDVLSYNRGASAQYNQAPYSNHRGRR